MHADAGRACVITSALILSLEGLTTGRGRSEITVDRWKDTAHQNIVTVAELDFPSVGGSPAVEETCCIHLLPCFAHITDDLMF